MRKGPVHRIIFSLAAVSFVTASLYSQEVRETEKVDFFRPEAWAMRYFTAATLMDATHPPTDLMPGKFAAGIQVANIPRLSQAERTVGFYGTKEENLNKASVLVRPLLHYGISERFSATATYVPPIEVFSRLKTHLAGASINFKVFEYRNWSSDLRLVGQWATSTGDFTVAEEVAGSPDRDLNPLGGTAPSNDIFRSRTISLESIISYRIPGRWPTKLSLHAAGTYADLMFQVDAHLAGGFHDTARLSTSGRIWSFGIGVESRLTERISARLSGFYAPLHVKRRPSLERENDSLTNVRLAIHFAL